MLETCGLTQHRHGKRLINKISLKFTPGLLWAILGPNGAGKSTLFKTITGIWQPTGGQVLWKLQPLHTADRRTISQTISLIPQNGQSHFDFTVWEFTAMGRYPASRMAFATPQEREIVDHALKTVDAWHLRHTKITHLSQGELQCILIARALATESPVLLCDEPTANLDIRHQLKIWQLLHQISREGRSVIISSHDLNGCAHYCDQVAVMDHGSCVAVGSFAEAVDEQILNTVFCVATHSIPLCRSYCLPEEMKNY